MNVTKNQRRNSFEFGYFPTKMVFSTQLGNYIGEAKSASLAEISINTWLLSKLRCDTIHWSSGLLFIVIFHLSLVPLAKVSLTQQSGMNSISCLQPWQQHHRRNVPSYCFFETNTKTRWICTWWTWTWWTLWTWWVRTCWTMSSGHGYGRHCFLK